MNVKNLIIGIGIFIIYLLAVNYGIHAFYPEPKYEKFCSGEYGRYSIKQDYSYPSVNCTFSKELQKQVDFCYQDGGNPIFEYDENGCNVAVERCDYCNKEYNESLAKYNKNYFLISLILGIITLLIGYFVLFVEPVGSSLMAAGVGAIFFGSVRNWQNLSDILRFVLLLVALILLVWIGLRVNKKK